MSLEEINNAYIHVLELYGEYTSIMKKIDYEMTSGWSNMLDAEREARGNLDLSENTYKYADISAFTYLHIQHKDKNSINCITSDNTTLVQNTDLFIDDDSELNIIDNNDNDEDNHNKFMESKESDLKDEINSNVLRKRGGEEKITSTDENNDKDDHISQKALRISLITKSKDIPTTTTEAQRQLLSLFSMIPSVPLFSAQDQFHDVLETIIKAQTIKTKLEDALVYVESLSTKSNNKFDVEIPEEENHNSDIAPETY